MNTKESLGWTHFMFYLLLAGGHKTTQTRRSTWGLSGTDETTHARLFSRLLNHGLRSTNANGVLGYILGK